jgi:hypothetical protein
MAGVAMASSGVGTTDRAGSATGPFGALCETQRARAQAAACRLDPPKRSTSTRLAATSTWEDAGTPIYRGIEVGAIAADTIREADGKDHAYAYVRGSDGHLKSVWWSGTYWEWDDHGKPGPSIEVGAIGAVTGRDLDPGRPYGFVRGSDGHLWLRWWDGAFHWHDSGTPPGGSVENGAVSAVMVTSGSDARPHAFVRGRDGRLLEYVFSPSGDGSGQWQDRGTPPGRYVEVGAIAATTAKRSDGVESAHVFVRGSDGRLWLGSQQASGWTWADAGLPPGGAPDVGAISAVSIQTGSTSADQARAYVRGPGGRLWACAWSGTQCAWSDHGTPPGRTVDAGAIAAVAARSAPTAAQEPRIFVRGSDGHLWVSWWNGTGHAWSDLGPAAGATVDAGAIGATLVKDAAGAPERPHAFVRTSDGHLQIRSWTP